MKSKKNISKHFVILSVCIFGFLANAAESHSADSSKKTPPSGPKSWREGKPAADDGNSGPSMDHPGDPEKSNSRVKTKDLLQESVLIQSEIASVEEAIEHMYVGADYKTDRAFSEKVTVVEDLIKVEVDAIWELINDKSVDASKKEIHVVRYTLGDERLLEALLAAKAAGIKTTLVTDFNVSAEPILTTRDEAKYTTDFSNIKFKDSPGGQFMARLTSKELPEAQRFVVGTDVFSQPLYNSSLDRKPILHEKLTLLRKGSQTVTYVSTANAARNPRYNRTYLIPDKQIYLAIVNHVLDLIEVYKRGNETKAIASRPWPKIVYKDGSSLEIAYTDGKFNPNARMLSFLNNKKIKIKKIYMSHFVFTHRGVYESIKTLLEQDENVQLLGIFDDRFTSTRGGWGLAPALDGTAVKLQFGSKPFVAPIKRDQLDQVKVYFYQRPAIDPDTGERRIELSEEGPPEARHVYHDKTTVFEFEDEHGISRHAVFSGSFNLSNNIANSEIQLLIETMSQKSWIPHSIIESIIKVIETEPEYAVPALTGVIRNALGRVFGLTDLEFPLNDSKALEQAILTRNLNDFTRILTGLSKIPSALQEKEQVDSATRAKRLNDFVKFYKWYIETVPVSKQESPIRLRRVISLAHIVAEPEMSLYEKKRIISDVLWRPNITPDEEAKLVEQGLAVLNLPEVSKIKTLDTSISLQAQNLPTTSLNVQDAVTFDWDDTIAYMPTKIRLFSKLEEGKYLDVSTGEYADLKDQIGKLGVYKDYKVIIDKSLPDNMQTFQFFRTAGTIHDDLNYFKDDFTAALRMPFGRGRGPALEALIQRLSHPDTAELTSFLSARENAVEEFMDGLKVLQDYVLRTRNVKLFMPSSENVFLVGGTSNTPLRKAETVSRLLDRYVAMGIKTWSFVDDDLSNIEAVKKLIDESGDRWKAIKINIVQAKKKEKISCKELLTGNLNFQPQSLTPKAG